MKRQITGFFRDEQGNWIAELDCFHRQHARHKPPFVLRPWVETEAGRNSQLGEMLNCVRCDRLEFPEGLTCYKSTPEFTETTVPKGLLNDHATRRGTWGIIRVLEGRLTYTVCDEEAKVFHLSLETPGIVVPERRHYIQPEGKVRFLVEFYSKSE